MCVHLHGGRTAVGWVPPNRPSTPTTTSPSAFLARHEEGHERKIGVRAGIVRGRQARNEGAASGSSRRGG